MSHRMKERRVMLAKKRRSAVRATRLFRDFLRQKQLGRMTGDGTPLGYNWAVLVAPPSPSALDWML